MIGQGLQQLLTSPMAGGQQQQFPDPTDIVGQVMGQFEEWLRKRGTGVIPSGGRQGIQQPAQSPTPQSVQPPVGITPRESAGRLRTAAGEGAATFMQQAGETAAEPWKPKALDIGLMAATIALPIIAAMQPEGRGRRGLRKQQRMGDLFKTLGGFAGQGLQARMGSFEAGKEATFGAAKTRAEMSVDESHTSSEEKDKTDIDFGGEIYFPKPFNEEQRRIIEKIRSSNGVLVQGPPGTGKSHTIANLICHLLAMGKRILITAKTPRALKVLEGHVPAKMKNQIFLKMHKKESKREKMTFIV